MLKKMMLLALSVGALIAFAAPAAQADVQLTDVNGEPLAVGSEVTATSTNLISTLGAGRDLECEKVTIHATVTKNGLNHVTLGNSEPNSAHEVTTTNCFLNITNVTKFPAIITKPSVKNMTIATDGIGTATATFTSDVPALALTCSVEGAVGFTYNLATPGDVLTVPGSTLTKEEPSGEGCGASLIIEGSFTLENAEGAVTID